MNLIELLRELGLEHHLQIALLGLPRISVFLAFTPFLGGSSVLTGQMKVPIIAALYFFIHPVLLGQLEEGAAIFNHGMFYTTAIIVKESFLGFLIAYLSSIIFWAAQSAGFVMDNQRGASQSSVSDPLAGEETSPLGSFFFQSLVYLFFASGAFLAFLSLVFQTYVLWPVDRWLFSINNPQLPIFIAGMVSWLMSKMLLLAGAVLIASLLVDFALGLINRFASQLNVYILSMPIKSGLAILIVLALFPLFVGSAPGLFEDMTNAILSLQPMLSR
ncbi:MAG: type III secretion system export apparatus subunit SctT [Zoogloeaceae bacterium]|jgi:type III secretion protein T|nr:type III secretion system export apparatus subunit SctT [Zoogloeaceae bacterium]